MTNKVSGRFSDEGRPCKPHCRWKFCQERGHETDFVIPAMNAKPIFRIGGVGEQGPDMGHVTGHNRITKK